MEGLPHNREEYENAVKAVVEETKRFNESEEAKEVSQDMQDQIPAHDSKDMGDPKNSPS